MLFPLPRPLSDLLRDTSSSLAPLDKAGAVANALLLASHPWLRLHHVAANEAPPAGEEESGGLRARPWASLNLFFDVRMRPRFPLFDACDGGAADASLAQAPPVHRQALERLGVGPARAAYCAHI